MSFKTYRGIIHFALYYKKFARNMIGKKRGTQTNKITYTYYRLNKVTITPFALINIIVVEFVFSLRLWMKVRKHWIRKANTTSVSNLNYARHVQSVASIWLRKRTCSIWLKKTYSKSNGVHTKKQEWPIIYRHKITQILRNYRRNFQPQEAGSWLQLLQS